MTQPSLESPGRTEAFGPRSSGCSRRQALRLLQRSNVPVDSWEVDGAESLERFLVEVERCNCDLRLASVGLVRESNLVLVDIFYRDDDGNYHKFDGIRPDGEKGSVSDALQAGEDYVAAALRLLSGPDLKVEGELTLNQGDLSEHQFESSRYPGVTERYVVKEFSVFLSADQYRALENLAKKRPGAGWRRARPEELPQPFSLPERE